MLKVVEELIESVKLFEPKSKQELEGFRLNYLGKKGRLNELFALFKDVPEKDKKSFGKKINLLKNNVKKKVSVFKSCFDKPTKKQNLDLTKPVPLSGFGGGHPISLIKNQIIDLFNRVGIIFQH